MLEPTDKFGVVERKGQAVVSSRYVAETFKKRHDNVLRDIEKIKLGLLNIEESSEVDDISTLWDENFIASTYKNNQNKKQPEYLLTRDGFTLLAIGFTGKEALKFKINYIRCFNKMEIFIKSLQQAKFEYPAFTNAIMNAHEKPSSYHYSNEINMINKIVLGLTASEFKKSIGLSKDVTSIRPYLTTEQITAIETLQRMDIGLMLIVSDYQQRKVILQQQYDKMVLKSLS